MLPAPTSFNTGRLRDAVLKVNKAKALTHGNGKGKGNGTVPPPPPPSSGGDLAVACGDGLSVNTVTSCPFARAVRDEYQSSGGSSSILVTSPVTHQTYPMTCVGALPTICRGGNNAAIAIR